MDKLIINQHELTGLVSIIAREIVLSDWKPDYIVGLTRGGLIPSVMLSHYLDVPMHTLNVSFRDTESGPESNLWMAEDAFGYDSEAVDKSNLDLQKKILIVDDINDSGFTLNWIKKDWQSSCLPNYDNWNYVWGDNVRFAALINNDASGFKDVSYVGKHINKLEKPVWCVFPWESWWCQ